MEKIINWKSDFNIIRKNLKNNNNPSIAHHHIVNSRNKDKVYVD